MKVKSQFYSKEFNKQLNLNITRAKVVRNSDPKKIGRVQIRIPSYHGVPGLTTRFIEDKDLPWAIPCFFGGCGQDMGSFLVPIPGSFVWVMFEDNDLNKPVYLGGIPSVGSQITKTMNNLDDPDSEQQSWDTQPGMSDIAWDEFDGKSSGVPERGIIYKSQKGHTIMFDDTDGSESMTFIDRVGQVIKFFSGVTKAKNGEKYHRELSSAENNDQLGEGLTEDSSIMLRSGEVKDAPKLHSMFRMFSTHMRAESIDSDEGKHTTTDYSPTEYHQETQDSKLNMTEEHIYISFPEILQYFCSSYWALTAFEKNHIECTKDHLYVHFGDNGLTITEDEVKLHYKDTEIVLNEESLKGSAKSEFLFETDGASIGGQKEGVTGKGKDIKFEGSGSVYTKDGKTYMTGTEIHFNRG